MGAMAATHRGAVARGRPESKRRRPIPAAAGIWVRPASRPAHRRPPRAWPHGCRAASSRRGGKRRTAPAAAASSEISGAIGPAVRTPRKAVHRALERIADRGMRRGRLIAAMGHAVGAFFVASGPIGIPVGGLHQLLEGLGVAFAEQIAGLLPAKQIARRHAPRRAVVFAVAGEEIEEQARMHQVPLLALAQSEDAAEQLLGLAAVEEVLLVGRALIGIAGRDRYADAEFLAPGRGTRRYPRRHGHRRSSR